MNFDGIDWTELSKFFGLFDESDDDETVLKKTKEYLLENHFPYANDTVADTIRLFLVALHDRCLKDGRYSTPIWNGLLEVRDNRTLIKYTIILLEHMWY